MLTSIAKYGVQNTAFVRPSPASTGQRQDDAYGSRPRPPAHVKLDLSPEARAALEVTQKQKEATTSDVAFFQQFRQGHYGFNTVNLAISIVDSSAQPFSQNRPFDEVAQAARESLDANSKKLLAMGRVPTHVHATSEDVNSLFGELDRRALFAVASNEGGIFSEQEQSRARSIMRGQQGMAMGLYHGPTELKDKFTTAGTARSDHMKNAVGFLDEVSAEEKAQDAEWAVQRAGVESLYETFAEQEGKPIDPSVASDHPVVLLILDALEQQANSLVWMESRGLVKEFDDLKRQPWFAAHAGRLDDAVAAARERYLP